MPRGNRGCRGADQAPVQTSAVRAPSGLQYRICDSIVSDANPGGRGTVKSLNWTKRSDTLTRSVSKVQMKT
jgi:hypothetical protein